MAGEKRQELALMLESNAAALKALAPKYVNIGKLGALAIEALMRNPMLAQCSPVSVLKFCKACAEAGTDRVGAGGMWAVPFRNKQGGYDMQAIPDWRLMVEKARLAGVIKHASAEVVHERDAFEFERGLNPRLVHKPVLADPGPVVAAYCVYTLADGSRDFAVMTRSEVDGIRGRSKAGQSGPWVTDFAEMAKKTVIRRALKIFEGASPELSKVFKVDNEATGFDFDVTPPEPIKRPRELPPKTEAEPAPEPEDTELPDPKPAQTTATEPGNPATETCQPGDEYLKPNPQPTPKGNRAANRQTEAAIKGECVKCGKDTYIGAETKLCAACRK